MATAERRGWDYIVFFRFLPGKMAMMNAVINNEEQCKQKHHANIFF